MEKADTGEFVSGVAGDYNSLLSAEMVKEINEICGRYPGSTKVVNGFAVWTPLLCLAVIQGLIAHSEFFCDTDFSRGLWKCASRNVFIARFILSRLNEVRGPKQIASYIQQLRASATQDWARKLSSRKPHSSKELDIPSWLSSFARPFPDGTLSLFSSPKPLYPSRPSSSTSSSTRPPRHGHSRRYFSRRIMPLQQRAFVHPTDGLGGLRLLSPCRLGYSWFEFRSRSAPGRCGCF
ncbi:hypothetical protein C8F01DRAFT_660093 [Mycena amicta]|nr:hypothetical protein C8F01DRAFT_660093 [Mycena amicta]